MEPIELRLIVNGTDTHCTIEPRTMLADHLRDALGLTGTHLGCEHGVCGACTVLVDDQPTRACITLAAACAGARVTTVEGLTAPLASVLRQAFAAEHALQCGFCTPGMLISALDLLERKPGIRAEEIRREMSGNLCRCTGYVGLVRAIEAVSLSLRGNPE